MIVEATCKFCGKSLSLEVDDDYAKLGDPYNLIELAACNRCADLRVMRRSLHKRFEMACNALLATPNDKELADKAPKLFENLTKRYLRLISSWTSQELAWEEGMVDPFVSQPANVSDHLKQLWRLAKTQQQLGI